MTDQGGLPDKRSLFRFCPNSGDFSVDSLHKRLFLTPLTGEIFERQKVPNLIWRSWSELVDSYSWVYKSHKNQRNRISYAGWDARIFDTSWVGNMLTSTFHSSVWYDAAREGWKTIYFVCNFYVWTAAMRGERWWENNTLRVPKEDMLSAPAKKCLIYHLLHMPEHLFLLLVGMCDIASGYEQLANCVCCEQIGIIAALMGKLS